MNAAGDARVRRVSGPLVQVAGLDQIAMAEIVEVGRYRLPGEVVAISDDIATVQVYEYTGGWGLVTRQPEPAGRCQRRSDRTCWALCSTACSDR